MVGRFVVAIALVGAVLGEACPLRPPPSSESPSPTTGQN